LLAGMTQRIMYNIGAEKANDLKDQSVIKDGKCDLER
jgi:hypothetical protein